MKNEIPKTVETLLRKYRPINRDTMRKLKRAGSLWWEDDREVSHYYQAMFQTRVLERLDQEGLSQTNLAKRLKVTRQYVSKMLSTESPLSIYQMTRIASALRLRLEINLVRP